MLVAICAMERPHILSCAGERRALQPWTAVAQPELRQELDAIEPSITSASQALVLSVMIRYPPSYSANSFAPNLS